MTKISIYHTLPIVFSNTVATGAPVLYVKNPDPQLAGVVPVAIK